MEYVIYKNENNDPEFDKDVFDVIYIREEPSPGNSRY